MLVNVKVGTFLAYNCIQEEPPNSQIEITDNSYYIAHIPKISAQSIKKW